MIAALDSSFARPTPAQAAAARAAGVRVWLGYIGTRPGLGLASLWDRASFDIVRNAGMLPVGYGSGWDDPVALKAMAASWGVVLGVDVEPGIRDDGPWVRPWVQAAGAGLYGLASVHYQPGEPIGRGAAWNVMANYPGFDPGTTWIGGLTPPAAPHGWQWQGDHQEFGLEVDSNRLEDSFLSLGGPEVATLEETDPIVQRLLRAVEGSNPSAPSLKDEVNQLWGDLSGAVDPSGRNVGQVLLDVLAAVKAIPAAGGGLTPDQAKALTDTAAAIARLEAALKQA